MSTKGSKPIIPSVEEFLQSDSTSIRLNFSSWANLTGECPIMRYSVEYKTDGTNWISGKNTLSEANARIYSTYLIL